MPRALWLDMGVLRRMILRAPRNGVIHGKSKTRVAWGTYSTWSLRDPQKWGNVSVDLGKNESMLKGSITTVDSNSIGISVGWVLIWLVKLKVSVFRWFRPMTLGSLGARNYP